MLCVQQYILFEKQILMAVFDGNGIINSQQGISYHPEEIQHSFTGINGSRRCTKHMYLLHCFWHMPFEKI